jgi:hypothetical protein
MSVYRMSRLDTSGALVHRYQQFVDLSNLVRGGRAVLVGEASRPTARLLRDGRPLAADGDRQWAFYRFVIPVRQGASP